MTDRPRELVEKLRKMAKCVYLSADDISGGLTAAADFIEQSLTPPEGDTVSEGVVEQVALAECPIGLFWSQSGELCLKTEYGNNEGRIDAYIVSSGEFFWGAAPQTIASQRAQLVTPIDTDAAIAALQSRVSSQAGMREAMKTARDAAAKIVRAGAPGCGNGNKVIANEIIGGLHDDYMIVQIILNALSTAQAGMREALEDISNAILLGAGSDVVAWSNLAEAMRKTARAALATTPIPMSEVERISLENGGDPC